VGVLSKARRIQNPRTTPTRREPLRIGSLLQNPDRAASGMASALRRRLCPRRPAAPGPCRDVTRRHPGRIHPDHAPDSLNFRNARFSVQLCAMSKPSKHPVRSSGTCLWTTTRTQYRIIILACPDPFSAPYARMEIARTESNADALARPFSQIID
jgi:hypothetical protein